MAIAYNKPLILNDPTYSDIRIIVRDQTFYCHESVLSAEGLKLFHLGRMQYFTTDDQCTQSLVVELNSLDPAIFRVLLEYIYSGTCPNPIKWLTQLDALIFSEFFKTYDSLAIRLRKSLAEILRTPTIENAVDILQLCIETNQTQNKHRLEWQQYFYQLDFVKRNVKDFISDNFSEILKSSAFLNIDKPTLVEILELDRVCENLTGEIEIFEAILKYADHQINIQYPFELMDRGEFLGADIVRLIRYPTMTETEFSECMQRDPQVLWEMAQQLILHHLKGGPLLVCGFSIVKRFTETSLDDSVPNRFPCPIQVDGSCTRQTLGSIPTNQTVFSVNYPVPLTDVWLYRLESKKCRMTVTLKNSKGKILASGNTEAKSFRNVNSYQVVTLSPRIELRPLRKYTMVIEYDVGCGTVEFYEREVAPALPYRISAKNNKNVKGFDCEIVFEEINNMLVALSM